MLQFHERHERSKIQATQDIYWTHQGLKFTLLQKHTDIPHRHVVVQLVKLPQDTSVREVPQEYGRGLGVHTPPRNITLLLVVHSYEWYQSWGFLVSRGVWGVSLRHSSVIT